MPILHDDAQIVARDFGATMTPEAVCINAADMSIFYRGSIDDRMDAGTNAMTQPYLASALENFSAGRMVSPSQTLSRGCAIGYNPVPPVSYSTDIAPLIQNKCVRCHSPGNIAPWAITNYSVIQARAYQIKQEVLAARMPPWHADPLYLAITNDLSLSPDQKATLLRWINDGAPRGAGPDPLAAVTTSTNYPFAWPPELGQPDYIVTIPSQSIPATGKVSYKYPSVQVPIPSNTWLRAAIVKPGNTKVVHHCLVFQGTLFDVISAGGGLNGFFAGYVPGYSAVEFPTGTGKKLPANSPVTFQMHYITIGTPQTDQTQLGLYFMKSPPPLELQTKAAFTLDLQLPPGAPEYEREASFTPSSTQDVWLYEMSPHMHLRGSRFKFEALYPDGGSEVLLSVPHYVFHWQSLYRLAQPKRLPAGTVIRCRGAFDNSQQNLENPNPNAAVTFGEQTDDEMFIGYANFGIIP
ncbi:MAG: alkyl hydroperoxide reductase [Verrucomicrobia bacterium]|nr:MAG: alkyl hydroperoxide reductase [Verrucomicrobiota bacterium]